MDEVAAAARGDAAAAERVYAVAQAMQQTNSSTDVAALGKGLQRILEGSRGDEVIRDMPADVVVLLTEALRRISD